MILQSFADTARRAFFICVITSVSSVCFSAFVSLLSVLCLTDLEDFKTHRRSPVRVREGQGVVLLCGPPPHSGGKMAHCFFVLIAILQSQSIPLWANISTPRSVKSRRFAQKLVVCCHLFLICSLIYRWQSGTHRVCWIVKVSGVSHFYFASLWPVSPVLCWDWRS